LARPKGVGPTSAQDKGGADVGLKGIFSLFWTGPGPTILV